MNTVIILKKVIVLLTTTIIISACGSNGSEQTTPPTPPTPGGGSDTTALDLPKPNPMSRLLYNNIALPTTWPPYSSYSSNIYSGMSPFYLSAKPSTIDITMGRQLFVDNFLISSTSLTRKWYLAEYYSGNPIFKPEEEWEMQGSAGGGFAAPFSDGVWFDETDGKFKMWYMGGGNTYGDGNYVTCYAESADGISWTRPSLALVSGTNIVHKGQNRDAVSVWIDKTATDAMQRYKMFNVYGGAGNWKYHYLTSADGKAWREQTQSGSIADRSTAFYNPFRGVWVYSMRHNVRVDANTLIRARDYYENANPQTGTSEAKADLQKFWFGPWPSEPKHPIYTSVKPAIYNFDAIAYESVMLGQFSVWSGPENDVAASDHVIKRNQILLGFSRDGWNWYREDFTPFCPVDNNASAWNNGNVQSAVGSPIIVGDKLYFYMSGRRLNSNNAEVVTTGLATLRRDGFASMNGTGELITERLTFKGRYFYINASGKVYVELLDANGVVIEGFAKADCIAFSGNSTKQQVKWKENANLLKLDEKTIRVKFYVENGDIYSFWISQHADGRSYGYTAGGGAGYNKYGLDF